MADPTIVLVHGAFADASGFRGLYDELLGEQVTMIAPPNPLRGLTGGDGDYLKGVIGEIDGPVLLVGHSYGGSVITVAGTAENVVGLVYISGFAPDEGENLTDLQSKFPPPGIIPYVVQHELPGGGNEFTLAWRGSTSHSAPTSRPPTRPSTRSASAPSPALRSPRRHRPRRGAAVRSGRCFRPPTGVLTPAFTTSAMSVWAPR
jgi:pimeloyl-ACP methyl ester carboxylesterase